MDKDKITNEVKITLIICLAIIAIVNIVGNTFLKNQDVNLNPNDRKCEVTVERSKAYDEENDGGEKGKFTAVGDCSDDKVKAFLSRY